MGYFPQPIISYADATVGVVFFNLSPSTGEANREDMQELISLAKERHTSSTARQQYVMGVMSYLELYHHTLLIHEWYHILQAIAYPFLYLRSVRDLYLSFSILTRYRKSHKPVMPLRTSLPPEWLDTLYAPAWKYRISINDDGMFDIQLSPPDDPRSNDLTENDLLEEDASIFQYKVEIGSPGSGKGYKRWLRECQRNRYTMTFNFLAQLLGEENAYVALPPLVRAAFCTTKPVEAFASLVADTIRTDVDLPTHLGMDEYFNTILHHLREYPALKGQLPDIDKPRVDDEGAYIDRAGYYQIIKTSERHPLQPLAHALWVECGENPLSPHWLFHPYTTFIRNRNDVYDQLSFYQPPLTVIRLLHPGLALNDSLMIIGEQFVGKPVPFFPEMTYDSYVRDVLDGKHMAYSVNANRDLALPTFW